MPPNNMTKSIEVIEVQGISSNNQDEEEDTIEDEMVERSKALMTESNNLSARDEPRHDADSGSSSDAQTVKEMQFAEEHKGMNDEESDWSDMVDMSENLHSKKSVK